MINIDFKKWRGLKEELVSDEKPHFFKEASISFAFPPPSSSYSVFGKSTINNSYVVFY